MVPFETIQGFITSTSNLLRETNANTCLLLAKIERMETTQHTLTRALTTVLSKIDNVSLPLTTPVSAPSVTITPGPPTLISEYFDAVTGMKCIDL